MECAFVFVSEEVQQLMADVGIGLEDVIHKADPSIRIDQGSDPAANARGIKDPVTILMASAAIVAALTPTIIQVLRSLSGRPVTVTERVLEPIVDATGATQAGPGGEPLMRWSERVTQESDAALPSVSVSVKGFGIEIKLGG